MSLLLRNVTALVGPALEVTPNAAIAVEKGRISGIHRDQAAPNAAEFATVLDGQGQLATPGFINAHTHLAMVLLRGYADDLPLMPWLQEKIWPREAELTAEEIYWGSLLGLAELIRSGTTCFADMYFHMDQVAEAVAQSGLRAMLAYGMIAPEGGAQAERELDATRSFVRTFEGAADGRIRTAVAPHAPYTCDASVWEGARDIAEEHDVPIHTHLAETRDEIEQAHENWGGSPVERLEELGVLDVPLFAAHGVHLSERDRALLAEHNVGIIHNPTSNLKLASGFAPVEALRNEGVPVGIGTDGAASNNNLDLLEEIRLATFCQKAILDDATALPAREALALGTAGGAQALGWPSLGALEPGRDADIVLWETDRPHWVPMHDPIANLVYAAQAGDVATVIVDGVPVMAEREIQAFDEEEAIARVRAHTEKNDD